MLVLFFSISQPQNWLPLPVMLFAPSDKVDAMRALLLQYGAKESKDDKDRWQIRKDADLHEMRCTKAFYEDDRHLCPVGAALDLA